jgi:hypothetical protein
MNKRQEDRVYYHGVSLEEARKLRKEGWELVAVMGPYHHYVRDLPDATTTPPEVSE